MGNLVSDEAEGETDLQAMSQGEDSAGTGENLLDSSVMFDIEGLHKALVNIRDPPGSGMAKNKEDVVKWLKKLVDRDEASVNIVQWVDYLTSKGVSREEAMEAFADMDPDGEGSVDITYVLTLLKDTGSDPMQALHPCKMLPGQVDIYVDDKSGLAGAGKRLIKFLQRQRVEASRVTVPSLEQLGSVMAQREKLVHGRYHMLLEKDKAEDAQDSEEGEEGVEKMVISKCYHKVVVSSNPKTVDNLTDGRMDSYWQSNGSPRSHWIRIHMVKGVMLKELAVAVDTNDDSYMPKNLSVLVGNSENNLKDIRSVQVPRDVTGRFVLLRNLGSEYRYVQINIRGCHSDGCDTRIRGVFVKGCKFVKEVEPTVLDTMVIWYLNILASTAKAAMPVAPQLRDTILAQSKTALRLLRPLSLSPTSPAKPEFLSSNVVAEMDQFLTTLCLPGETYVTVDADSIQVLLSFALAHGSANSILDCLQILLDNLALELPLAALLRATEEMQRQKLKQHAECLKLSLVKCDGGQKDDSHSPECMLTNELHSSSNPYISESGRKVVNVVVKSADHSQLLVTKVLVKVQNNELGAKAGLVFLFNHEDPAADTFLNQFTQYDSWTLDDFQQLQERRKEEGNKVDQFAPVGYFEPDKDSREVELSLDITRTGQFVMFKFLGPLKEDAERLGVHCIKIYGHRTTKDNDQRRLSRSKLDLMAPLPTDTSTMVEGSLVLTRVLSFLAELLRDLAVLHARRKANSLDPTVFSEPHIAVENLSLEKIWNLYIPLTLHANEKMEFASLLCLDVLRASLPFLNPRRLSGMLPASILAHLCGLLDSSDARDEVQRLAQDIVVDGVVVFFPDAKARKDHLLTMINSVLDGSRPRSWWLKFEALCHYFSKTDSNSLLGLPTKVDQGATVDTASTLSILSTMLTVATTEALSTISNGKSRPDDLVNLLCALQTSMLFWCRRHMSGEGSDAAASLLTEYTNVLVSCSLKVLQRLEEMESIHDTTLDALCKTIVSRTLPEMLVYLGTVVSGIKDHVQFISSLFPLVTLLNNLNSRLPAVFVKLNSETLVSSKYSEAVLAVWTKESPHNYENNSRINEDFVCPSATKFVIEFDSRCRTERRYDYLQFTDASGQKQQFDETVGSDRWPRTAEFPGPKLYFYFHSDGSNNDWGYKFTLKAIGKSIPTLHWLFDLQISVGKLIGTLCSAALSTRVKPPLALKKTEEEKAEEALVHSTLWKSLLRGGYMVGKLTRSLSGAYAASPADTALSVLLQEIAYGPEGRGASLLELCRATRKGPFYGGPQVDKAVNAVFAALIWHSQEIREEVIPFATLPALPTATTGLLHAFTVAEAMRRDLVEARQKLVEAKEKEEDEDKRAKIDEDAPVQACYDKAVLLLKFAGLSRVQKTAEGSPSSPTTRPSWLQKSTKWQKVSNAVSTVGRLKKHLQGTSEREKIAEMHPSFELVLDFVKNEAISVKKVRSLLQQRAKIASSVAQVYTLAAEYIRVLSVDQVFELPGLAFLQQLLSKQRHFPKHYASKLDGCGLELENQVRRAYRMLIQRLIEATKTFRPPSSREYSLAHLTVSICLTHLLDFEWQDYDNTLLSELQLPEFFFHSAIKSSSSEEQVPIVYFDNEEKMLTNYRLHMRFKEKFLEVMEDGGGFESLMELQDEPEVQENRQAVHLFVVAYSPAVPNFVTVNCDGCGNDIPHGTYWYRDMEIQEDLDLCKTCFTRGTGERPDSYSKDQLFQRIGDHTCADCGMAILTHRFRNNACQDKDLCIGCFRKQEDSNPTVEWTVYPLTEQPATSLANKFLSNAAEHTTGMLFKAGKLTKVGPAMDLMVYNQQHCWILFSSLSLAMAHTIESNNSALDRDYVRQACRILMECLHLLAFGLRAVIVAKWEEQEKKDSVSESSSSEAKPAPSGGDEQSPSVEQTASTGAEEEGVAADTQAGEDSAEPPSKEPCPPQEKAEEEAEKEEDLLSVASQKLVAGDEKIGALEKTFASLAVERMLGLLAAILPVEMSVSRWIQHQRDVEEFLAGKLIPYLLQLSGCSAVESSCRMMALLVASQYMARVNPQVADRAVFLAHGQCPPEDESSHGLRTVQHLFATGARFLKRSDYTGAATAAKCLCLLSNALPWKSAIVHAINQALETEPRDMELTSIFGLLVIAGFPKLPHQGSTLCRVSGGEDLTRGVLAFLNPDGQQGTLIDLTTRETRAVKLHQFEVEDSQSTCMESSRLPLLLSLLKKTLQICKQERDRQLEDTWILALTLKAICVTMKCSSGVHTTKGLLESGLVPSVVKLASGPTHFSQQWQYSDLEVLGIHRYQPPTVRSPAVAEEEVEEPEQTAEAKPEPQTSEEPSTAEKATLTEEEATPTEEEVVLEGLSTEIQDMLKIMKEAFQCQLSVLRALYEAAGEDMNQFIMSSEQYYDMDAGALKPPDNILELAKKWEPQQSSVTAKVAVIEEKLEDMGVTTLKPVIVDMRDIEAVAEDSAIFKKAKNAAKDMDSKPEDEKRADHSREESHKLLQEEMKEKPGERKEVLKVYQAMVVLQARQVLASFMAGWSKSGPRLSTSFLGNIDSTQYFCLLDLLLRQQSPVQAEKVLSAAICCGEPTEVMGLALMAAHCMGEVCVGTEDREFSHPVGKDATTHTDKIVIPNASSMKVTFHPVNGQVKFSSKADLSEHSRTLEGKSTVLEERVRHVVPGDTVHFNLKLESVHEGKAPQYRFTVTGTQLGRFDTGFAILSFLLKEVPNLAPLLKLWHALIAVACQYAGKERLKVIGLLRKVLTVYQQGPPGGAATPTDSGKLELSSLKPLWQLYTNLMKDYDDKTKTKHQLAPEILRALTELFLTVENMAEDWGMSQDLMVDMITQEGLNTWLEKGISNVAYLSIALGFDNFASHAFINAKETYVPPSADGEEEEADRATEDSPSSSDDDDDDDEDDEDDSDSFDDSDSS